MRNDVTVLNNCLLYYGMKLSIKKLGLSHKVTYGGFNLGNYILGVNMIVDEERIIDLLSMHKPKNSKEVQSLLGLILRGLVKDYTQFQWTDEASQEL